MQLPVRISRDRVVLYGVAMFVIGLYQFVAMDLRARNRGDWSAFWSGGATAGTPTLMDPSAHCAFQYAHAISCNVWTYPPGTAVLFWPFAQLPFHASYVVALAVFSAFAVVAGALLADAFAMPRWFGLILAFAWAPIKLAIINGQNETFALLLVTIAILAAKRDRKVWLGLAVGVLLYKPTIGAPFALLLVLRKEWLASAVVAACAFLWYVAGVLAAAGRWDWPAQYAITLHSFARADFVENAARSVGLPDVLMLAGVAMPYAVCAGVLLFLYAIPKLIRTDLVAALSIVSVLCVAVSPHAWHYAPAVSLPAIFYVLRTVAEPARTWLVASAYVICCFALIHLPFYSSWNPEAIAVLGLTAVVLSPLAGEDALHVPQHQGPA